MKPPKSNKIISIDVVSGIEGPSLYINNYRIAGNKPWGGGKIIHSWKILDGELLKNLCDAGILRKVSEECQKIDN